MLDTGASKRESIKPSAPAKIQPFYEKPIYLYVEAAWRETISPEPGLRGCRCISEPRDKCGGDGSGLGIGIRFAVLAGAGVANAGSTIINGDVGWSPTATMAGFGTVTLTGSNHGGDAVTVDAKGALDGAYTDAAGRTATTTYGAIFDLQD